MADPMKIRASLVGDKVEVKVLMSHEMETGQRKDAKGAVIPAWFIQNVSATHNGKTVLTAEWGPAISKNPFLSFRFIEHDVREARVRCPGVRRRRVYLHGREMSGAADSAHREDSAVGRGHRRDEPPRRRHWSGRRPRIRVGRVDLDDVEADGREATHHVDLAVFAERRGRCEARGRHWRYDRGADRSGTRRRRACQLGGGIFSAGSGV